MNEGGEENKGEVKKIEKGNMVTIEDNRGNKKMVHGSIEGFTIRKAGLRRTGSVITGLDREWKGKRVLCVLLD